MKFIQERWGKAEESRLYRISNMNVSFINKWIHILFLWWDGCGRWNYLRKIFFLFFIILKPLKWFVECRDKKRDFCCGFFSFFFFEKKFIQIDSFEIYADFLLLISLKLSVNFKNGSNQRKLTFRNGILLSCFWNGKALLVFWKFKASFD